MKKLFLILMTISMIFTFVSCSTPDTEPAEKNELLPKPDEKLEFWVCDNVDNVNLNKYKAVYIEGYFGSAQRFYGTDSELEKVDGHYVPAGSFVKYTVNNYPDLSSASRCITAVEINDPSIDIYGLNVNSSREEFIQKFVTEKGFTIEENSADLLCFRKGECYIKCSEGSVSFAVHTTNIWGEVF